MKKKLIVLLASVMGMLPFTLFAFDYNEHWAKEAIIKWVNQGMIKGYEDGNFKPNKEVTRAEFAAFLSDIFGYSTKGIQEQAIGDLEKGAWYEEVVRNTVGLGFMQVEGGKFRPNESVTREEAAYAFTKAYGMAEIANIEILQPSKSPAEKTDAISSASKTMSSTTVTVGGNLTSSTPLSTPSPSTASSVTPPSTKSSMSSTSSETLAVSIMPSMAPSATPTSQVPAMSNASSAAPSAIPTNKEISSASSLSPTASLTPSVVPSMSSVPSAVPTASIVPSPSDVNGRANTEENKGFEDVDQISEWTLRSVATMVSNGYMEGKGGFFDPQGKLTRAEMIALLDRTTNGMLHKPGIYTENLSGNTVINTSDVVLKDCLITGTLYLGSGIGGGNVSFENCQVQATVICESDCSLNFSGTQVKQLTLKATLEGGKVSLYLDEASNIQVLEANHSLEVKGEGTINQLQVGTEGVVLSKKPTTAIVKGDYRVEIEGKPYKIGPTGQLQKVTIVVIEK